LPDSDFVFKRIALVVKPVRVSLSVMLVWTLALAFWDWPTSVRVSRCTTL